MKTLHLLAGLSALLLAGIASDASASLRDPSFGNDGIAINTPEDMYSSIGRAIAIQADGKIVVGGSCRSSINTDPDFCVWRFRSDGRADIAFGTAGMVRTVVPDVAADLNRAALDSAGNIYFSGRPSCNRSQSSLQLCVIVLRYTSTGQLDAGFNGTGIKLIQAPEFGAGLSNGQLAVRHDGRVLLAGICNAVTGVLEPGLCMLGLLPNGATDLTLGANGLRSGAGELSYVTSIRVASDGKIKVIGQCQIEGARLCMSHHLADGNADTSYGPKGIVPSSLVQGFHRSTFSDDGRAIGVEACAAIGETPPKICASRLTYIGNTDKSFANGAIQSTVFEGRTFLTVSGIVALDDDRSISVGTCTGTGFSTPCFARFTALGELDSSFGVAGTQFEIAQHLTLGVARHQYGHVISVGTCAKGPEVGRDQMCLMAIQGMSPSESSTRQAIEYRNAALDYYFLTSRKSDQDLLDASPGWERTGNAFRVLANRNAETRPLVRFYFDQLAQNRSRGLHFYTALEDEIALVQRLNVDNQRSPRLPFNEGIDSFVYLPDVIGQCAAGTHPVYRAFRGNARFPDNPNHRFTTNAELYAQLVDSGWDAEGVKFCAPQ